MKSADTLPYVIANVHDVTLAISSAYVQQIVKVPRWHAVPRLPPYARGLITFRGMVIPLIDLRVRLNMHSALQERDEMLAMLTAREQDHVRWLEELERAVREARPFTLARDPSKCAFGKWYDAFTSDDIGFASIMSQFDVPHRRIHGIADTALEHLARGQAERALALIESTRTGELAEVRRLFSQARDAFVESHNELAVVLAVGNAHLSVTVDHVESVEAIDPDAAEDAGPEDARLDSDVVGKVFRRQQDRGLAFLLHPDQLFGAAAAGAS